MNDAGSSDAYVPDAYVPDAAEPPDSGPPDSGIALEPADWFAVNGNYCNRPDTTNYICVRYRKLSENLGHQFPGYSTVFNPDAGPTYLVQSNVLECNELQTCGGYMSFNPALQEHWIALRFSSRGRPALCLDTGNPPYVPDGGCVPADLCDVNNWSRLATDPLGSNSARQVVVDGVCYITSP